VATGNLPRARDAADLGSETPMHLNARRLWQGELVATWEAVAEDVDFQQTFPETNRLDIIAQAAT